MDGFRFLVVEDEPAVASAIAAVLRRHGEAVIAATAADAMAELSRPCVWSGVVIDVGLPDGSGLGVLRVARQGNPLLRIMVLTGDPSPDVINVAHELHAQCFGKPLKTRRLEQFFIGTRLPAKVENAAAAWRRRYSLSEAETDVLRRAALGECLDDIALARESSRLTVKRQISSLLRLTGDDTLQLAVARLLREIVDA